MLSGRVQRGVLHIGNPHDEVLARRNYHAVSVGKLDRRDGRRVEVNQPDLLLGLNVPHGDLTLAFAAADHVLAIGGEPSLEWSALHTDLVVELGAELVLGFSLVAVNKENDVFGGSEQNVLAVGTEFHLANLGRVLSIIELKHAEGPLLVVLSVEEVNLLYVILRRGSLPIKTRQDHASVIEAAGAGFGDSDLADFLLVFPDARGVVLGLRDEAGVSWV